MGKKLKQRFRSVFFLKNKKEKRFLENGSKFMEDLIADCNGKSIPIRNFSSSQILKATNNFDSPCFFTDYKFYKWYKCIIGDRSYMVKKLNDYWEDYYAKEWVYNDIVLSARMSNHNNFLKLSGCCLEFRFPVLVFRYEEHVVMNDNGSIMVNGEESSLPLSLRIKIAKEIAIALTYLHTAFPKITVHRNVHPVNILLDGNMTAKLSGLSFAITLPEGKTFIEIDKQDDDDYITGYNDYITGYNDRAYLDSGLLTEYVDVYSFGVSLMVILTGKPPYTKDNDEYIVSWVEDLYKARSLDELIEPMIMINITSCQRLQMDACMALALRCCEKCNLDRPKMITVAKELKRIQQMEQSLDNVEITEEFSDSVEITEELVDATYGLLKHEVIEDGSSMVKWTKKLGFKVEIKLILTFCIGFLMALLFNKAYK